VRPEPDFAFSLEDFTMIAFVMSGGGNRGALQAGALLELLEANIQPAMLVGTSAGSLNAAFLATNPTLQGARDLADMWINARRDDFFPGGWLTMMGRLAQGQSLCPSDPLRRMAETRLPAGKRRFGDLQGVKLYITSASLNTGRLYLWGDKPEASIIDAVIASTAHPLAFPPLRHEGSELVDGGVVANVPVGVALDKGATEIYVLNVGYSGKLAPDPDNVLETLNRSISIMMYQPFVMDLRFATRQPGIQVHHISMTAFQGSKMWDVEHAAEMVEIGRRAARDYLVDPTGAGGISFEVPEVDEEPPAGAEPYVPPWLRQ
jgi:NTE family protein